MMIQRSIHFQTKLNEPGVEMNGFLLKLARKTLLRIINVCKIRRQLLNQFNKKKRNDMNNTNRF